MQSLDSLLSQEVAAMTWGPYALSATGTDTNKRVLGRIINDATKVSNAHFMTDTVRNLLFHGHKSEFLDAAKPLLQFVISNALPFPANIVFQEDGNFMFALYPVIMDYMPSSHHLSLLLAGLWKACGFIPYYVLTGEERNE